MIINIHILEPPLGELGWEALKSAANESHAIGIDCPTVVMLPFLNTIYESEFFKYR